MKVAIVGGGIFGITTAYFLAAGGADSVTVFERDNIASASTGYSAGIIRHHYSTRTHIEVAKRGGEIIANLDEYTGTDGGYHNNGYLRFGRPGEEAAFRDIVRKQQAAGVPIELIDPSTVSSYHPELDAAGITVASYDSAGGFADPYLVTTAFARAARELDATIHTKEPVIDCEISAGQITAVRSPERTIDVDIVVNSAGPWGGEFATLVGQTLPLTWHESKIAVLSAPTKYPPTLPTVSDHSMVPDMYVKPEPGGDFIVGGIDRPRIDPADGRTGVDEVFLSAASRRVSERFPGYQDAGLADSWSGVITLTPDGHQIIGPSGSPRNLYHFVGGNGHGFKEAAGFAESIAAEILGQTPRFDLDAYRPDRFASGETFIDLDRKGEQYR